VPKLGDVIAEALTAHMDHPCGRGHTPAGAFTGAAGGAVCGDLVRVSLMLDPASPVGTIADVGFDASGCGAVLAAGSAVVALVRGAPLLQAARVGPEQVAAELGGLSAAKRHAAELAADALHRALGAAARVQATLAPPGAGAPPGTAPPSEATTPTATVRRTLVAMSGGVDSAVAALLALEAGEEVVGVTLELWADAENDGERSCCSAQAVRGARALAHRAGMPHLSIDLREEFRAGVVAGWLEGYAVGRTPNPCIRCNGSVRLDAMLDLAARLGCERLVTGHYARVVEGPVPLLRVARDRLKDQSYALAGLHPSSLARLWFPLGEMTKAEVRELAEREGLAVAHKPDSQDLCFLAGTTLSRFLARHGAAGAAPAGGDGVFDGNGHADGSRAGNRSGAAGSSAVGEPGGEEGSIVDRQGRRLGSHPGAHAFTVGQRHGLRLPGGPEPLYVLSTDPRANTVTVGPRAALMADTIAVADVTLRRPGAGVDSVRVRSHGPLLPCRLAGEHDPGRHACVEVQLQEPVVRPAPGQVACLYEGDVILGYGIISA
jgi:tRNA-specific 2-thiouridylase